MPLRPEDAGRYGLNNARPQRPGNSMIERADEVVNIIDILEQMGCDVPRGEYNSWKMFCPFREEHPDGGLDKNFRVYPPTNVNCFAMHGHMKPTQLYSRWKNVSRERSALLLLEERGLLRPRFYRDRWNDIVNFREEQRETKQHLGSQTYLVDALTKALQTNPNYKGVEFTPAVREAWRVVLTALDVLWSREDTDGQKLKQWFDRSLTYITNASMEAAK